MLIPLKKVDAAQRLVYGQIDETPDRAGEVFDYDSSKPYFKAWSDNVNAATAGASLGNVRSMHGAIAAGKLVDLTFDDVAKSISLTARIVDDAEWNKVVQGVYTGFSPGGSYVKRWPDGAHTRYTAQPSEVSIVDLPCIPSASFTMVKADGLTEQRGFAPETLAKAGARNSRADQAHLQAIHDHAVGLGATCGGDTAEKAAGGDLAKMAGDLAKAQRDLTAAQADLIKMAGERDRLTKRVAELESLPQPGGPILKVFDKGTDLPATTHTTVDPNSLDAVRAMPPGPEKAAALRKYAANLAAQGKVEK